MLELKSDDYSSYINDRLLLIISGVGEIPDFKTASLESGTTFIVILLRVRVWRKSSFCGSSAELSPYPSPVGNMPCRSGDKSPFNLRGDETSAQFDKLFSS